MGPILPPLLAVPCAFLMGYAVGQGSTCAVSAARQLIFERRASLLIGFALAVGAAGLITLPLAWAFGDGVHLARETGVSPGLVAGAVLLGVGAVINGACLFGSLSRVGHGEVRYLALPLGLALGFAVAELAAIEAGAAAPSGLAHPSPTGFAVVAGFAVLFGVAWLMLGRNQGRPEGRGWPLRRAMVLLGVCGALLFALVPGWTLADAVRRGVATSSEMMALAGGAILVTAAAVAGAVLSSLRTRTFQYRRPSPASVMRSVLGGAVMAFGAILVPGGNDMLLLAAVPAATIGGLTAYAVMSATVPLLLFALRARSRELSARSTRPRRT